MLRYQLFTIGESLLLSLQSPPCIRNFRPAADAYKVHIPEVAPADVNIMCSMPER